MLVCLILDLFAELVSINFTVYMTDYDIVSFGQPQQATFIQMIQGLAPGIQQVTRKTRNITLP